MIKSLICIFTTIIMISQISPRAFAHKTSQEGILAKTYSADYKRYFIGGEDVGWYLDESGHTNGTEITYSFSVNDVYLNDTYKRYVYSGAAKWNGIVSINEKKHNNGTGKIHTDVDYQTQIVAVTTKLKTDTDGHLTSWDITINRAYTITAATIAHEFGHVIGLVDLYSAKNKNKLMYGEEDRTANVPSELDKLGAQVITGVHTSHNFSGYKYHSTSGQGINYHVKYCTICKGWSTTVSSCSYNAKGICTYCGTPKGTSPYSFGFEPE